MAAGVGYGLGSKIEPLSKQAGEGISLVDCSGFVRWVIYHAANGLTIPDGSVNQHDWADAQKFKQSDFAGALQHDNGVRIAFLRPQDTLEHVGHVVLIVNGQTAESHGHHGPDRRVWGSQGFMQHCSVYVLTPPQA